MSDTYIITGSVMEQSIVADPMGKPLGKQAAIVLAYSICQYTHDMIGIIKNNEEVTYFVNYDEIIGQPYFIPMMDKKISAYISQDGESYFVYFKDYIDVREYVNLHDGLSWDKGALQKYHRSIVRVDDKTALERFVEFLEKANVEVEWKDRMTEHSLQIKIKSTTKPKILNEYNLVDQLTKFFNSHPEISNQMNISNSDVEDFMDSIYDEDGEFHKDWLKKEVMDAVSEPIDISMELHNVDLSEEQLTYHNMNLQACIDKTDKLSQTIDWLLEKNPEYHKELSNCQATIKYNSEWMKDDMKLLDDRMNKVLSENIEKAVDQVIDATEPEVDFGMEM